MSKLPLLAALSLALSASAFAASTHQPINPSTQIETSGFMADHELAKEQAGGTRNDLVDQAERGNSAAIARCIGRGGRWITRGRDRCSK